MKRGNIFIVNKHKSDIDGEYIGRGSVFGNPYHHVQSNHSEAKFKVGSREEAICSYEKYFHDKIAEGDVKLYEALNKLIIRHLKGEDINLLCFCTPLPCHGEAIKAFIEKQKYCLNWFSNMKRMDKPIIYQNIHYWTVENFYAAMKIGEGPSQIEERGRVAQMNPFTAKKHCQSINIRNDWQEIRVEVMRFALKRKFADGTSWREKYLVAEKPIIEWNNWNDKFWGKSIFDGEGENMLGRLIDEANNI